eukprot:GFKZ01002892.1.p1 GENE.GFKZ01002892.1~~GFKZ01002892.1.p1  ORF type:complete len:401 (+),score=55.73 GFKZ01002892.1:116-1318(+)
MEGVQRTIPRSANRSRRTAGSSRHTPPWTPSSTAGTERYAPLFQTKREAQQLPQLRTGMEVVSPGCRNHAVAYGYAPLTAVRWLPVHGRVALAAVGSGCGIGGEDFVSIYGISVEQGMIVDELWREIRHEGRVSKMGTGDGVLYVGGGDGGVRVLKMEDWKEGELREVGKLPKRARGEGIGGLAGLGRRVCAFGEHGSIGVVDVEVGLVEVWGMCDAGGFVDGGAVDPEGGNLIVGAGRSGEVGVWDLREGREVVQRLEHVEDVPSCVTVDAAQGNFVIGGTRGGEVCVWDRRRGELPLNRALIHDGVVWEVGVVASSKPGLLLSAGEDGRVWLMDYKAAGCRGGGDGGDFWTATMTQSDLRDVGVGGGVGVNGVDAHWTADLFAFTSDSGSVCFGTLYS